MLSVLQKMELIDCDKKHVALVVVMDVERKRQGRRRTAKRDTVKEQKTDTVKEKKREGLMTLKQTKGMVKFKKSQEQKTVNKEPLQHRKSFTCEICDRRLSTKSNLQRHYSLKHLKEANS